ncbi:MAG: protease SohB, partial [Legionellaceae bacterium]|nr:protease SohB [Legionellaceae bacterium]
KKTKSQKKEHKPTLYVLDFDGDIKASQVENLRETITAVLSIATRKDEVVLRLKSPGGTVNGYGLAASQLQRIRDKNIPLTVCIDTIAASGGYLMASVAHTILAAPFAIIGSIGVVAQLPNFHRFLKNHQVDVELLTAGEYKRTLTLFGENTAKGREKFQEDLEAIHTLFKAYLQKNRPALDIAKVSTGEHWLAQDALHLHLVDDIKTSDDYLCEKLKDFNLFQVSIYQKPTLSEKLFKPAMRLLHPFA